MSFVGPRAVAAGEISLRSRIIRRRYDVRPGLICLWWVRQRANIAYEHEALSDAEYVESQSLGGDLALVLRAIPSMLYGQGIATAPDEFRLSGSHTQSDDGGSRRYHRGLEQPARTAPGCLRQRGLRQYCVAQPAISGSAQWRNLSLGDGIGIKVAARALGLQLKQNVNGTDLFPRLCEALQDRGSSVFLLGARPGIAEAVAGWISSHYPGVKLGGFHHGYFSQSEEADVTARIRASGATVLLVALGAPRQDLWIQQNLCRDGCQGCYGCGWSFRFLLRPHFPVPLSGYAKWAWSGCTGSIRSPDGI